MSTVLESKALLDRAEGQRDRRQVHLHLTRAGERLAKGLEDLQVRSLARVPIRLFPGDRKDVVRGLDRLVTAARGDG